MNAFLTFIHLCQTPSLYYPCNSQVVFKCFKLKIKLKCTKYIWLYLTLYIPGVCVVHALECMVYTQRS